MSTSKKKTLFKELEYDADYSFIESVIYNLGYPLEESEMKSFQKKINSMSEADKEKLFIDSFEKQMDYGGNFDVSWFEFFGKELGIKETYNCRLEHDDMKTIFYALFLKTNSGCAGNTQIVKWILDNIPEMEKEYKKYVVNELINSDYKESVELSRFNPLIYEIFKKNFAHDIEDIFIENFIDRKNEHCNKKDYFYNEFFQKDIKNYEGFDEILTRSCAIKKIVEINTEQYLTLDIVESRKSERDFESITIVKENLIMSPTRGHNALISLENLIDFIEEYNPSYLYNTPHKENYDLKIDLLFKSFIIEHRMFIAMKEEPLNFNYQNTEKLLELCNLKDQKGIILEGFKQKYDNENNTINKDDKETIEKSIDSMLKNSILIGSKKENKSKIKV